MNRITTTGEDDNSGGIKVDELDDDDQFSAGNYVEYCYQMKEMDDDILDNTEDDADTDESTFADALADKFTEGNFMGESDMNSCDDDNDDMVENDHEHNMNNVDGFTAGNFVEVPNDENYDGDDTDADAVIDVDEKTAVDSFGEEKEGEPDKHSDDEVEYYWSDDDGEDGCDDAADTEVMISLMTSSRQDFWCRLNQTFCHKLTQTILTDKIVTAMTVNPDMKCQNLPGEIKITFSNMVQGETIFVIR